MTRKDVENLWNLLDELYPDAKQDRSQTRRATWFLVLEPYAYGDVKTAAIERSRENKYPPERVAEIAVYVKKAQPPTPPETEFTLDTSMQRAIEELPGLMRKLREMGYHDD